MATLNPKMIISIALGFPIIYIWQKMEFSVLFLAGIAFWAWKTFDEEYVHKSEVEKRDVPKLGPEQPFFAAEKTWEITPDGTPIAKYQAPQQYPTQRGR